MTRSEAIDQLPGEAPIPEINITVDYIEIRLPVARGIPEAQFVPRRCDVYFDKLEQAKGMNALAIALRTTGEKTGQNNMPVESKSHVLRWIGQAIYDAMNRPQD